MSQYAQCLVRLCLLTFEFPRRYSPHMSTGAFDGRRGTLKEPQPWTRSTLAVMQSSMMRVTIPLCVATASNSLEPAIWKQGRLVVARNELAVVDVFESGGRFLARLPRPGEAVRMIPRSALAFLSRDTLALLDRRARRLAIYSFPRRGAPAFKRTVPLPRVYHDMCALRDRLVFFRIGAAADVMLLPIRAGRPDTSLILSRTTRTQNARVVCDTLRSQFYVIEIGSGAVQSYDGYGRVRWTAAIAGLSPQASAPNQSRVRRIAAAPGAYHILVRALMIDRCVLLLQYKPIGAPSTPWGRTGRLLTVGLRANDGSEVLRTETFPPVIAADDGQLLVFDSEARSLVGRAFSADSGIVCD